MNEIWLIAQVVLSFGGLLLVKKFFGKAGIYSWITIMACLAQIQTSGTIPLFGMDTCMGTVLFASIFLSTDILRECYGQDSAKKGPWFALLGSLIYIVFAITTPLAKPSDFSVDIHNSMSMIFSLSIRITVASIVMMVLSNMLDIFLYDYIYKKTKGKMLWLRNNVASIISNCLENYFFVFLAFIGVYDIKTIFIIATSTSIIELIVSILDTPFLYLARKIHNKED